MKKTKYIGFRISAEENERLERVRENIAADARGQKPEIADIIRCIVGWGNRELVSPEERAFLAGEIGSLHGNYPAISKSAAAGSDKTQRRKTR